MSELSKKENNMQLKKILLVIGLIVVILGILFYSRSESHFLLNPYIDTIFSKDFSWDKFNKVSIGVKKEEVQNILGEPLRKFNSGVKDPSECWEYSADGKLAPYADFSWYSVKVCFTQEMVSSKPIYELSD